MLTLSYSTPQTPVKTLTGYMVLDPQASTPQLLADTFSDSRDGALARGILSFVQDGGTLEMAYDHLQVVAVEIVPQGALIMASATPGAHASDRKS